jgi:hypothetical protein
VLSMEDHRLQIDNLEVRISMLRKKERQLLAILADDSQSSSAHNEAREELRIIMGEILADAVAMRKLDSERRSRILRST